MLPIWIILVTVNKKSQVLLVVVNSHCTRVETISWTLEWVISRNINECDCENFPASVWHFTLPNYWSPKIMWYLKVKIVHCSFCADNAHLSLHVFNVRILFLVLHIVRIWNGEQKYPGNKRLVSRTLPPVRYTHSVLPFPNVLMSVQHDLICIVKSTQGGC